MNWYIEALKKYAVFSGRARRKEHWYFVLFSIIISIPLLVIDIITGSFNFELNVGLLSGIYSVAMIIPSIAVAVRRLHDTDRSGWWLLIIVVPLIGFIVLLIFTLNDSDSGDNRFGSNPKAASAGPVAQNEAIRKVAETTPTTNVPLTTTILAPELKGRSIVNAQNISYSGSLPKSEAKSMNKSFPSDEAFYEKAFNELESADRKVGLWAKVFSEAEGNEALAKANYLKIRSGQFANEYQQAQLEEERQRQAEEKEAAEMEHQRQEEEKVRVMERAGISVSPTTGAKFFLIHAGTFMMGSPVSEKGRDVNETQHQVTISKPFYLQTTTVTQGQWKQVMENNTSNFSSPFNDCPVDRVSWNDVQEFIGKLNSVERTDSYRLPTEAEWEYACRAGSTTTYCFGNDPKDLSEYAWYSENSTGETHTVGEQKPNEWGLYDMHGNVWEWVQDWEGNYPLGSVTDPEGPSSASSRVNRGGGWESHSWDCRSARRDFSSPESRFIGLGFRLAKTVAVSDAPS